MAKFEKAVKEKIWLKILLNGPSGSGKTYSALRLATGIAKRMNARIAAIDTENGRIRYYADEFDFDDMELFAPYKPEDYIQAITDAVEAGYGVLIIDSISHEWNYCLDVHSKMTGNSYTNWSKITPRHDAFTEKILQSKIHIISTARGKDEYILEERNGKQVPKKVGIGYRQREGLEYNYSIAFNIDQATHVAEITKDNTKLFENRYEMLTEKDGEAMFEWANSSKIEPTREKLRNILSAIDIMARQLSEQLGKDKLMDFIKILNHGSANYKKINNIETAEILLEGLKGIDISRKDEGLQIIGEIVDIQAGETGLDGF